MKNEELLELIRLGENPTVDFKDSAILSNPNSIAKLMVAFANTMGGKIIFGIKNNKKFEGLKFKGGHEMTIMNIARDKCDPPISPHFEIDFFEEGEVYIVTIPRFKIYPHALRSEGGKIYYIRVGTTIREPSPMELKQLFEGTTFESPEGTLFVENYPIDFKTEYIEPGDSYRIMRIHPKVDSGKIFEVAETKIEEEFLGHLPSLFWGFPKPMHDGICFTSEKEELKKTNYSEINENGYIYFHENMNGEQGIHIGRTLHACKQFLQITRRFFEYVNYDGWLIFHYDFINLNDRYLTTSPGRMLFDRYTPSQNDLNYEFEIDTNDINTDIKGILRKMLSKFTLSFGLRLDEDVIESHVEEILIER